MTLLSALPAPDTYKVTGSGALPSVFAVSELATASFAAVGQELARLMRAQNLTAGQPPVTVDHRLASLWYGWSLRPDGWTMPSAWDPVAGDYRTADGWIRLHTNLAPHRAAALKVMATPPDREAVSQAVSGWNADELEAAIVAQGGVAAAMRSRQDWLAHPQGRAVASEPLVAWTGPRRANLRQRPQATPERPLAGLRVLDLTRVLAGPVSTRTLAGFGAEVLRIDPPEWDEPGVIPDISLGKRCAYLDLKSSNGLARLKDLLEQADVFVHGYRPGALDGLGLNVATRNRIAPNRVEVALDAYGWHGPWAKRRGFDSLVQMSAGIAHAGQVWAKADKPTPLPVQALDHATGYLMAAAVLSALAEAVEGRPISDARLSLARTAELLVSLRKTASGLGIANPLKTDFAPAPEQTGWGNGFRLSPALAIGPAKMCWALPAPKLGTATPDWD